MPFTAQIRMSGIDLDNGQNLRKGAVEAVTDHVRPEEVRSQQNMKEQVEAVCSRGATPLLVCEGNRIAGLVVLEDILKPHIRERLERLRGWESAPLWSRATTR